MSDFIHLPCDTRHDPEDECPARLSTKQNIDTQIESLLLKLYRYLFPDETFYPDSTSESKPLDEAHKAIKTLLIQSKIDELENLQKTHIRTYRQTVTDNKGGVYVDDTHSYISEYETLERIAKLKEEL